MGTIGKPYNYVVPVAAGAKDRDITQLVQAEAVTRVEEYRFRHRVSKHCYLVLAIDGNRWFALFGSNIQSGIGAFGETPTEALENFEAQFKTSNIQPPIPSRAFDWSAWVDGQDEWKTGRGATEDEAIRDLLTQIEEAG